MRRRSRLTMRVRVKLFKGQLSIEGVPVTSLPPDVPSPRVPGIKKRAKRCYELSYLGLQRAPQWTLVHGCLMEDVSHAWLELGDLIYDGVFDQFFHKAQYPGQPNRWYTLRRAQLQMITHGHYGPWDGKDVLGIPLGHPHSKMRR